MIYKSPLKYSGSKLNCIDKVKSRLKVGKRLVEPFVGSGTVFLNTDYDSYLLADINPDLINFFQVVKDTPERFITLSKAYFTPKYNTPEEYYNQRDIFNSTDNLELKAVLFLYLNRHCFNGLCRYNLKGVFNVAFGKYKSPYYPEQELRYLAEKSKKATFICSDFNSILTRVQEGDVVYADPPYSPIDGSLSFTSYHGGGFTNSNHENLLNGLIETKMPFVISNHKTTYTDKLYKDLNNIEFPVRRSISCVAGSRVPVLEVLVNN